MGGIFINYRGEDSGTAAVLIDRELTARFGDDRVFLDCRSIPAGVDFVEVLLGRLRECSVLLVLIGPRWLTLSNEAGARRIDDQGDWIRREIVEALKHGLRVIPVLIDGADLPTEPQLPPDLAGLSRRQYMPLRRRYVAVDIMHLINRIVEIDPELAEATAQDQSRTGWMPRRSPVTPGSTTARTGELAVLTTTDDAMEPNTTELHHKTGMVENNPGMESRSPARRRAVLQMLRRRITSWGSIGLSLVGGLATLIGVALIYGATSPDMPDRPAPKTWSAKVDNTWSTSQHRYLGTYTYRSPFTSERGALGYGEGVTILIECQERNGRKVTDPSSGRSSTVWNRTTDGVYMSDLYTDLPDIVGEIPPDGIPKCGQ